MEINQTYIGTDTVESVGLEQVGLDEQVVNASGMIDAKLMLLAVRELKAIRKSIDKAVKAMTKPKRSKPQKEADNATD